MVRVVDKVKKGGPALGKKNGTQRYNEDDRMERILGQGHRGNSGS